MTSINFMPDEAFDTSLLHREKTNKKKKKVETITPTTWKTSSKLLKQVDDYEYKVTLLQQEVKQLTLQLSIKENEIAEIN